LNLPQVGISVHKTKSIHIEDAKGLKIPNEFEGNFILTKWLRKSFKKKSFTEPRVQNFKAEQISVKYVNIQQPPVFGTKKTPTPK